MKQAIIAMQSLTYNIQNLVITTEGQGEYYMNKIQSLIKDYQRLSKEYKNETNKQEIERLDEKICESLEKIIYPPIKNGGKKR